MGEYKNKGPVLAQYTIRSKQEYIFKTNRIVEIVGASENISTAWEKLFACAEKMEMKVQKGDGNYNHANVLEAFEKRELNLVELFCGGGNDTLLFDSFDSYKRLNEFFSFTLLKECPGMIPMSVCVEASNDYKADYEKLMSVQDIEKNKMTPGQDNFILPFSLMDKDTYLPMTRIDSFNGEQVRYSEESYSKRKKGIEKRDSDKSIKYLDDMVTKKGEESMLAIVHADGNNMGSKIMSMLADKSSYDDCVNMMREFTADTAMAFSKNGIKKLEEKKEELLRTKKGKDKALAYRVLIADGDDVTFICNASYAMDYVEAYINAVQSYNSKWQYSSCAGICIFHSHYPVAKAYDIAEQACDDGAKKMVHKVDEDGKALIIEEGWVDFHYIHSGIGGNLEGIRKNQNTLDCMARPWQISGEKKTAFTLEKLKELSIVVRECKVARSSMKSICAAYEESEETGKIAVKRIFNHNNDFERRVSAIFGDEVERLKALYDYGEVMDLWYKGDR